MWGLKSLALRVLRSRAAARFIFLLSSQNPESFQKTMAASCPILAMNILMVSICRNILAHKTDEFSNVGVRIYKKPDSNDLYNMRRKKHWIPLCKDSDNPDAAFHAEPIGEFEKAYEQLLQGMERHNRRQKGGLEDTVNLLLAHRANEFTYTSLIDASCKTRNLSQAPKFRNEMVEVGVSLNIVTYTTLLDGLCEDGKIEEVEEVFQEVLRFGIRELLTRKYVMVFKVLKLSNSMFE